MLAVLCTRYGPPEVLETTELPSPMPGEGEVLIGMRAVCVSQANVLIIANNHPNHRKPPFSPGGEVAGVVKAVGRGVTDFKPGDAVLGHPKNGGCAQEVIAPAARVHRLPAGVDFKLAAAASSHNTSLHALRDVARVQKGETVLVLGAAGGVGLAAVDLAKMLGARVIACASTPEKLDLCRRYGADELVNYTAPDFRAALKAAAGDKGVDVAIDPVGGDYAETAVRSMGWGGRYVIIGFVGGSVPDLALNLPLLKGCSVMGMSMMRLQKHDPHAAHAVADDVIRLLAEERIRPHIHAGATYPLARTVDALKDLAGRRVLGKAVITNDEN